MRNGFTLIEMLIVISIIALLTGVIGANFITSRVRARDSERKNSLTQLRSALEIYYNDHGRYPEEQGGRILGISWGTPFCTNPEGEPPLGGGCVGEYTIVYMAQMPSDNRSPIAEFMYESNPEGSKYRLYARLENEEDPGTDLNDDGESGDEFNGNAGIGDNTPKYCGGQLNSETYCNFGIPSPSTTMTENW